ncbi:MAG: FlgD immunoglobulin-like domain containing protein [Candidatus Eisenbacteria bacterium]
MGFSLPFALPVTVRVHDLAGREVFHADLGRRPGGENEFVWDGRDSAGRPAAPGIYFIGVRSAEGTERIRRTLLR